MRERTLGKSLLFWFLAAFLAACAARSPLDTLAVDQSVTLEGALADPDAARNRTVQWGGRIVNTVNLQDTTQIEVLAYPLDRSGRPDPDAAPLGRFLAVRSGYLEAAVYAPGRLLTLVGPVTGTRRGKIGDAEYTYAVVSAEQIHLWPVDERRDEPRFHFGVGVVF